MAGVEVWCRAGGEGRRRGRAERAGGNRGWGVRKGKGVRECGIKLGCGGRGGGVPGV